MKVLVVGAGSIGNHLTQASRRMGWDVVVIDTDPFALKRMCEDIYPQRYGAWDEDVTLVEAGKFLPGVGEFDIIMIGTPPDSHAALIYWALALEPMLLHVEKPLCTLKDDLVALELCIQKHTPRTLTTIGYDHAVARSVQEARERIAQGILGEIITIDAMTRESFRGILGAHPWLTGVHETYLGYSVRGGGALGEHSHGFHLGLLFAEVAGWGAMKLESSVLNMKSGEHGELYDRLAHLVLRGEDGNLLHVTQDVICVPARKGVWVQGVRGRMELALSASQDTVTFFDELGVATSVEYPKKRPDDFFALVQHYDALLSGRMAVVESPVRVATGIEVMRFIQEAFTRM